MAVVNYFPPRQDFDELLLLLLLLRVTAIVIVEGAALLGE